MTQGHYRICPLCEAACGLRIETEAGRVTRIRGAEDDPFSRGYLCQKRGICSTNRSRRRCSWCLMPMR